MSKLFEQTVQKVRQLPDHQQDEAAEILLSVFGHSSAPVRLSPKQRAEVTRRLQDKDLTYATDEEVEAFYRELDA